jgi:hypothetical protein
MTARTQLHNFQGRAAGLEFETVRYVGEDFAKTFLLVAVETSLKHGIGGQFLRQGIQIV